MVIRVCVSLFKIKQNLDVLANPVYQRARMRE